MVILRTGAAVERIVGAELTLWHCGALRMPAILELPEVRERISTLSVAEYQRLDEFNGRGRRTELIRGIVIEKLSKWLYPARRWTGRTRRSTPKWASRSTGSCWAPAGRSKCIGSPNQGAACFWITWSPSAPRPLMRLPKSSRPQISPRNCRSSPQLRIVWLQLPITSGPMSVLTGPAG